MSLDQVAIRIVNSVAAIAQVSLDRAQGCEDCQNDEEQLLHKSCACIATSCRNQQSAILPAFPQKPEPSRLTQPRLRLRSFLSFLAQVDAGERNDPRGNLGSAVLTEGRLERQFLIGDLG